MGIQVGWLHNNIFSSMDEAISPAPPPVGFSPPIPSNYHELCACYNGLYIQICGEKKRAY
jgi:hypothetical protein